MSTYIKKAQLQIDDIVINKKDAFMILNIILRVLNRRRIPFPRAVYDVFSKVDDFSDEGDDEGSEDFLKEYIIPEPGKCLVDVGANVGNWTLLVAKKGREVYAYEPMPKAFRILKQRAKKFPQIHPFPYAIGDRDSSGRLGITPFAVTGTMDEEVNLPGGETIDVPVRKLDSLNFSDVGVIKIDTEGYETPILQGAKDTITKNKPVLIIEVHKQIGKAANTFTEEKQRIENILVTLNYKCTVYYRQISLHGEMQPFLIGRSNN
ncbi:MAG: FkbM family methyltransferase [Candidatus Bathyarchaeota archaeon]|nr:FkbM family methyltransferase [Candidatus Bathyarchaeota archaeon]